MAYVSKGVVTQVLQYGAKAVMRPLGGGKSVTPALPVQKIIVTLPELVAHKNEYNTGEHPEQILTIYHPILQVGDLVAFVLFEDGTGKIIDKIE